MTDPALGTEIQQETNIPACTELSAMEGKPKKQQNQTNFMHDGDNCYGESERRACRRVAI